MQVKTLRKGDTAILQCMLRDTDGTPLVQADGVLSVSMTRDFSPFGLVTLENVTATLLNTPRGTTINPDQRWIPGIDGKDGFNVEVIIPGYNFQSIGTYLVNVKITKNSSGNPAFNQVFRVHVGSGQ